MMGFTHSDGNKQKSYMYMHAMLFFLRSLIVYMQYMGIYFLALLESCIAAYVITMNKYFLIMQALYCGHGYRLLSDMQLTCTILLLLYVYIAMITDVLYFLCYSRLACIVSISCRLNWSQSSKYCLNRIITCYTAYLHTTSN